MGVPTLEVGYTSATTGRGNHEDHKGHVVALEKKDLLQTKYVQHVQGRVCKIVPLTNLKTYLHNDTSETELIGRENSKKSTATIHSIRPPGKDAICVNMLLRSDLMLINDSKSFSIYLKTLPHL
jgi:hypothetical protein